MFILSILIATTGWFFLYILSVNNAYRAEAKDTIKEYVKSCLDLSQGAINILNELSDNKEEIGKKLKYWNEFSYNQTSYIKQLREELISRFSIPLTDENEFIKFINSAELPIDYNSIEDIEKEKKIYCQVIPLNTNQIIKKSFPAYYQKFPTQVIKGLNKQSMIKIILGIIIIFFIAG